MNRITTVKKMNLTTTADPGSFRDPSGFIFRDENLVLKRCIHPVYQSVFRENMENGLYEHLISEGVLIPHRINSMTDGAGEPWIIEPEELPMISYPYEWCFDMYKDAALLTLQITKMALQYNMILKDASAYNVQFRNGRAVFIDTLSFTPYREGDAWAAYGQFCRHFFAPLYLCALRDLRLGNLMRHFMDGVPLDMARNLLPWHGGSRQGLIHILLHSRSIADCECSQKTGGKNRIRKLSGKQLRSILEDLEEGITNLSFPGIKTPWAEYNKESIHYSGTAREAKFAAVENLLMEAGAGVVWDMGANDGTYTRLALKTGSRFAVAFDGDLCAVNSNYLTCRRKHESLLPLVTDLSNPSSGNGFAHTERKSLTARCNAGCLMMLALIHHLAISNNLPFDKIAAWCALLSEKLIIEFVPENDPKVQELLMNRQDVFPDYTLENFILSFEKYFRIRKCIPLPDCDRRIFLFERKGF